MFVQCQAAGGRVEAKVGLEGRCMMELRNPTTHPTNGHSPSAPTTACTPAHIRAAQTSAGPPSPACSASNHNAALTLRLPRAPRFARFEQVTQDPAAADFILAHGTEALGLPIGAPSPAPSTSAAAAADGGGAAAGGAPAGAATPCSLQDMRQLMQQCAERGGVPMIVANPGGLVGGCFRRLGSNVEGRRPCVLDCVRDHQPRTWGIRGMHVMVPGGERCARTSSQTAQWAWVGWSPALRLHTELHTDGLQANGGGQNGLGSYPAKQPTAFEGGAALLAGNPNPAPPVDHHAPPSCCRITLHADVVTVHGTELRTMPGTLARWYQEMGGEVSWWWSRVCVLGGVGGAGFRGVLH